MLSDEPACSKPDQKTAARRNSQKMTPDLLDLVPGVPAHKDDVEEVQGDDAQDCVRQVVGDVGQGERDRAVGHKESECNQREHDGAEDPVELATESRHRLGRLVGAQNTGLAQRAVPEPELDQAQDHAESREREPQVPVVPFAQQAAEKWSGKGSYVDPHVEDREPRVALGPALRVQIRHHRTDVGLEQSGADDDEDQAEEERVVRRHRHAEVPCGDDAAAHENRLALSPELVGDPAAR